MVMSLKKENQMAKTEADVPAADAGGAAPAQGLDGEETAELKTALDEIRDNNDQKLLEAGELERLKNEIKARWEAKLGAFRKAAEEKEARLQETIRVKVDEIRGLVVRSVFEASTFIREKTVLTPNIAYHVFGGFFQVEDTPEGPIPAARFANGERIMSKTNPQIPAEPEEAIEALVNAHVDRDAVLKAGKPGTGAKSQGKEEALTPSVDEIGRLNQSDFIRLRKKNLI